MSSQAPADTTGPAQGGAPREAEVLTQSSSGSDYMVDVLKSLGLDYVCANPGSSFRGLHESVVNHGGNSESRVHHLLSRRVVSSDGARLLQGRRKAARRLRARHRRPAARVDGDLQRLLRSSTGLHRARQHARRDDAAAGLRVAAQRAGRGRDGARLHEMGRHASLVAALRRVGGSGLQDRDDAAVRTGRDRRRHRAAGEAASGRIDAASAEADARRTATGRFRRRRGSGAPARRGHQSRARRRQDGAHRRRAAASDRACGAVAGGRHQPERPHEFSVPAPAEPLDAERSGSR